MNVDFTSRSLILRTCSRCNDKIKGRDIWNARGRTIIHSTGHVRESYIFKRRIFGEEIVTRK